MALAPMTVQCMPEIFETLADDRVAAGFAGSGADDVDIARGMRGL
jgi:hypothetical protein